MSTYSVAVLQVIIKAMLTVPQRDGSLHLVRGHPALTKRNLQTSKLMDVCYKEENGARTQAYGQVRGNSIRTHMYAPM